MSGEWLICVDVSFVLGCVFDYCTGIAPDQGLHWISRIDRITCGNLLEYPRSGGECTRSSVLIAWFHIRRAVCSAVSWALLQDEGLELMVGGTQRLIFGCSCPSQPRRGRDRPLPRGLQSQCNPGKGCNPCAIARRDRPPAAPSSIYPGGPVELLRGDCDGIGDCNRIGQIALGLKHGRLMPWDGEFCIREGFLLWSPAVPGMTVRGVRKSENWSRFCGLSVF